MARLLARGLLAAFAVLTACAAPVTPPAPPSVRVEPAASARTEAAPVRAAPTRPAQLWAFTRLRGVDYIAVRDLAERFALKPVWTKPGMVLVLSDARGVRFTFENNQRDFYLDGVRVFLSEPAILHKDALWVGKADVIKTIAPIFRPAEHVAGLPAPPKLIVLDAGHGGSDPGKQNLRLKLDEKDMTLDVVLRLKKLLEARGFRVVLTRETDRKLANDQVVDLEGRALVANKANADLFISIHFNAVDPRDAQRVSGSETYVLTPQFQVSTQPEQDKTMVPTAYPGNRWDLANSVLGFSLHRQLITGLKLSDRGYKRFRYAVLRPLNCPGALLEAAYLSNDAEAGRVGTAAFRQRIAEAVADGVQNYAATLAAVRPAPPPEAPRLN